MPVERSRRDSEELPARVDAGGRLKQERGQIADAEQDVKAVHAGQREERRAEDPAARPRHVLAVDEMRVLVSLTAEEARAEYDRREQEPDVAHPVSVLEVLERVMHRRAGTEEHDRVPGGKRNVEPMDSRRRPSLTAVAQVEIGEDERREEHAVADQEEQEALQTQLSDFDVELIGLSMGVVRERRDGHQCAPAITGGVSFSSSSSPLYGSGCEKSYGNP